MLQSSFLFKTSRHKKLYDSDILPLLSSDSQVLIVYYLYFMNNPSSTQSLCPMYSLPQSILSHHAVSSERSFLAPYLKIQFPLCGRRCQKYTAQFHSLLYTDISLSILTAHIYHFTPVQVKPDVLGN